MKRPYIPPTLTEYGSAEELTLGGGDSSWDISVNFDPRNPNNTSISGAPGSGCITYNGTKYGTCS